jgi:hypothetical protein
MAEVKITTPPGGGVESSSLVTAWKVAGALQSAASMLPSDSAERMLLENIVDAISRAGDIAQSLEQGDVLAGPAPRR